MRALFWADVVSAVTVNSVGGMSAFRHVELAAFDHDIPLADLGAGHIQLNDGVCTFGFVRLERTGQHCKQTFIREKLHGK